MRKKLLVISHSYLDPENRKNLTALSRHFDVKALVPKGGQVLLSFSYTIEDSEEHVLPLPSLRVFGAEYVFLTIGYPLESFVPDVILVDYSPWNLVCVQALTYRAAMYRNAKLICFAKKNTYREYGGLLRRTKNVAARFLTRHVDHFFAGSSMTARMLRDRLQVSPNRISIEQHLGVDVDSFAPRQLGDSLPVARDSVVVGYCGRFDEDKGVLQLIDAVRDARKRSGRDLQLSLVGRGTYTGHIYAMAAEHTWLRVASPVEHNQVPAFLRTLDLFVLASKPMKDHEEHDAHILLEAMACGVPCIASDVGRIPDILDDRFGRLIRRSNSEDLVNAIILFAENPELRRSRGFEARAHVRERFSVEQVAKRKADVIDAIIQQ